MEVKFARTAFIGGVRYKEGLQQYGGPVEELPDDAKIDGVKVGDMDERKLAKAKKNADKADFKVANSPAQPAVPFDEVAFRKQVEDELRAAITEEVKTDPKLRGELKAEVEAELKAAAPPASTPNTADPFAAPTKAK